MNKSEFFKLSNTSRLALGQLYPCEFRIRGLKNSPFSYESFKEELKESQNYILFPSEHSKEIGESHLFSESKQKKILIIPDGNWSQAAQIAHKIKNFVPCTAVSLKRPPASDYQLRKNPNLDRISTFEATFNSIKNVLAASEQKLLMDQFAKLRTNVWQLRGKSSNPPK